MKLYLGHVGLWFTIMALFSLFCFTVAIIRKTKFSIDLRSVFIPTIICALFSWMAHKFLFGG